MGISRHDDGGREESSMDITQSSSDDKPHLKLFSSEIVFMERVCVHIECVCILSVCACLSSPNNQSIYRQIGMSIK